MDRNQEVLALINNVKDKFTSLTEQQREVNRNMQATLNRIKEKPVQAICKGKCVH